MAIPSPASDRAAVVTGASSGIGAELARELSRRGHRLVLVARSADKLRSLADELGNADAVPCDLAAPSDRADLLERVTALGVTPDILVNNAGFSTLGPVHAADPAAEVNLVEVDVASVVDLCSRFLPGMVSRGRGAVLNVASTAAFQPLPGQAAYAAAKSFVLSYTQSLRGELRRTGVTATVLCPGPVDTAFAATAGFSQQEAESALPKFLWEPADRVAKDAIAGLDRGQMVVIPGLANQVSARLAWLSPRKVLVPILAKRHPGLH